MQGQFPNGTGSRHNRTPLYIPNISLETETLGTVPLDKTNTLPEPNGAGLHLARPMSYPVGWLKRS